MSTTFRATGDPAEFKATAFPFLQGDPVLNSVMLSNTEDRIRGIMHDPLPPVLVSIHQGGEVVGAVTCMAHRGILLGGLPDALVPAAVEAFLSLAPEATIVEGTSSAARTFAEQFAAGTGRTFTETRGSRLHKLGDFVEQKAEGKPRQTRSDELALATHLVSGFGLDIGHDLGPVENERWAAARIELGRLWFWEHDGRVMSMVGHQSPVFGATRIGPVYTPASERGHGYASALTAEVSRRILDSGSEACLFTDLANPTSNKIYAAIGYRPVADFLRFDLN